jgi:hypothetical protein
VSDIDTGVVDSLKALDPDGRLEKRTFSYGCALYEYTPQFSVVWRESRSGKLKVQQKLCHG